MEWEDVLPPLVAKAQKAYERQCQVLRMREAGLIYKEIGERLGVCRVRARQIAEKAKRMKKRTPPVVLYFERTAPLELRVLSGIQR